MRPLLKVLTVIFILFAFYLFRHIGAGEYLTLDNLKEKESLLKGYYVSNPIQTMAIFAGFYILATALSLPGATILTLGSGVLFSFWVGIVLVSFASTIGATLAFLTARFLFKETIQNRFREKLERINAGVKKDGAYYLLTLRLIPLFPFFLVNLIMGLTPIRTMTYFFVSQIGMLPATAIYVNAGTQLGQIHSPKEILSPSLLFSFLLIGLLPFFSKWVMDAIKSHRRLGKHKKPSGFDYNMVVIGAGSAGLVSAYIASVVKAKVALIEKHKMGGDCLNTGCVPSKAFIRSAKMLYDFKRAQEFGLETLPTKMDFAKVMERVQAVIKKVEPHDSIERYTNLGVECIKGDAKIRSAYEVEVNGRVLKTKAMVIATGASPLVPPIPGLADVRYLTSDNVWNLRTLPERLVILGGGPIGCELAQSFARFGSQVSLVEMAPRIMVREDEDVSSFIKGQFNKEGILVLTGHKALRVEAREKILICVFQGKEVKIPFDEILVALGRKANVKGFGLEELGIEISPKGTIDTDEHLRTTNYPNLFACGDVAGPFQFTHTASHQAWYVAINALFRAC